MTKLLSHKFDLTSTCLVTLPDLLLSGCQPSLAIMLSDDKDNLDATLKRFSDIQRKFGNSIGIITNSSAQFFDDVSLNLPSGTMRLMHCKHLDEVLHVINEAYNLLKDKEKLSLQTQYFANEKANLSSVETARDIMYSTFHDINIPEGDLDLMLDGFPSISKLITTPYETMVETSPVDLETIEKVTKFFN